MQRILITGASSGIGAATARLLASQGHHVTLVARSQDKLIDLANEIGERATVEACDASDGEAVLAMATRVRQGHGVPDVIINAAGAGQWKRIEDTTPTEAVQMMQAPYFAAFNVTHAFMPDLLARKSGLVIHVNSPAAIMPWPSAVGYGAARWALRGLHETLHQDVHGTGVRTSHVVFGKVANTYFEHNPGAEEKIPSIAKTIRTLTSEECAGVLARVIRRPRRQVIHPFMLRFYYWNHWLLPGVVRWLLRATGATR